MTEQTQERYTAPSPPPKDAAAAIAWVYSQVGYVQKVKSPQLSYTFASEAALIAALRPPMVAIDLIVFVSGIDDLRQDSFTTKSGAVMQRATVLGQVTFQHVLSQTTVIVRACGEGMDSGDKSVNKAMTGMLKYALRQTFLIETGDDPDTAPSAQDLTPRTGRRSSRSQAAPPVAPPPSPAPAPAMAAPAAAAAPPPARKQHAWDEAAISEAKRLLPPDTPIERVVGILNLSPYTPKDPLPKVLAWLRIYVAMRPADKTAKLPSEKTAERATAEHQRQLAAADETPF